MSTNGPKGLPIRSGHASEQGVRPTMEDEVLLKEHFHVPGRGHYSLFGVFDGHGGRAAAIFTRERLFDCVQRELSQGTEASQALTRAYLQVDREFVERCRRVEEAKHQAALQQQAAATAAAAAAAAQAAAAGGGLQLTPSAPHRRQRSANLAVHIPSSTPSLPPASASSLRSFSAAIPASSSLASSLGVESMEKDTSGTTAVTVLLHHDSYTLYVANVGDSRAVLSRSNGSVLPLTNDHKADRPDEVDRIRRAGGFVVHKRVMGELAISRAIGDVDFKETGFLFVLADPELCTQQLSSSDQFVVLCCDGLVDVMSNEQACTFVREALAAGKSLQATSEAIVKNAIHNLNTRDNVTVVIVQLPTAEELKAAGVHPAIAASDAPSTTHATFHDSHIATPVPATPATPLAAQTLLPHSAHTTSAHPATADGHSAASSTSAALPSSHHSSSHTTLSAAPPLAPHHSSVSASRNHSAEISVSHSHSQSQSGMGGGGIRFHDEEPSGRRDANEDEDEALREGKEEDEQAERSHSRSKSDEKQQMRLNHAAETRS